MATIAGTGDYEYRNLASMAGIKGTSDELVAAGKKIAGRLAGLAKPSKAERRVELARKHGYTGTDQDLEAKGRQIRAALKEVPDNCREQCEALGRKDMDTLLALTSEARMTMGMSASEKAAFERTLADSLADDDEPPPAPAKPAAKTAASTPTPAATKTGMGADGILRCTSEQLRDAGFTLAHQPTLAAGKFEIVDRAPSSKPGHDHDPYAGLIPGDSPWRDPAWCMANQGKIQAKAKEVMNLPLAQAGAALESIAR